MVIDPTSPLPQTHLDIAGALLRIGDADALRDMLSMMAELLAADTPKIAASLNNGDLVQAAGSLHSLKGCIPIFCTPLVGALVAQSELSARQGVVGPALADYRNLEPVLLHLQEDIARYLQSVTLQSSVIK